MHKSLWMAAATAFAVTALCGPDAMADDNGQGSACVAVRTNADGQPWIGDGRTGFAIGNVSRYYYWLDHDHLCYGGHQFQPPRPS